LFFGEVLPQAICTGPNQIKIAAMLAPLIKLLMIIMGALAYPIAKVLDCWLGVHSKTRFKNSDLKELIKLHTLEMLKQLEEDNQIDDPNISGLSNSQAEMIAGVIDFSDIRVEDIMKPYNEVTKIGFEEPLTNNRIQAILSTKKTLIPVYIGRDQNNIMGILNIINLLIFHRRDSFREGRSLRGMKIPLEQPLIVNPNFKGINLFYKFKNLKTNIHFAFVAKNVKII